MMKKILLASALSCAAMLAGVSSPAKATPTNLLTNGSFEDGNLTGWTEGGNFQSTVVTSHGNYRPESGSYYLAEGPVGSNGTLSQTLTTVAGATYLISGWLIGNGTSPSDFSLNWDGTAEVTVNPVPNQTWTYYSAEVTGTGRDTFTVAFQNNPSYDGIDNLAVSAVPEPASMALLAVGMIGTGVMARRRRSAPTATAS